MRFLLWRRCGVYTGAVCDTPSGLRATINTNSLDDRARFTQAATAVNHDGENLSDRLARRAGTWTPAALHRPV